MTLLRLMRRVKFSQAKYLSKSVIYKPFKLLSIWYRNEYGLQNINNNTYNN